MEGTELARMYRAGEYTPPSLGEYVYLAARAISRLRPEMIVHRITGDCPRDMLVAPDWNADKNRIIAEVRATLEKMGQRQGSCYVEKR